ncbi:MAG: HAD hydrolase-like protein, partial [Gammaproteobacteria bacterium]|nr:HAD hydrolase-like protein [Gammaproteobacteria bacterium]
MRISTVLFDLDGTLADTAPDMAAALNQLLKEYNRAPLAFETIRPSVSGGSPAMLKLGFGVREESAEFKKLRQRFLDIYNAALCVETKLFPGMDKVLSHLDTHNFRWGVVTNKPGWLTEPLLYELALKTRSACIISGDTTARRKPHPDPLFKACADIGCEPAECIYVG